MYFTPPNPIVRIHRSLTGTRNQTRLPVGQHIYSRHLIYRRGCPLDSLRPDTSYHTGRAQGFSPGYRNEKQLRVVNRVSPFLAENGAAFNVCLISFSADRGPLIRTDAGPCFSLVYRCCYRGILSPRTRTVVLVDPPLRCCEVAVAYDLRHL